jgi:putative transposase
MPRRPRIASGGLAYHVLNRAAARSRIFNTDADYLAMERVIDRTFKLLPIRIVTYCLMPTHWHMVLWPREDGQISEFLRLLTVTHTQRWHAHHHSSGTGPLYQGRFKSFPIQQDDHFLTVCRYVERNPLRANHVKSASKWPWSGLSKRASPAPPDWLLPLNKWPAQPPPNWSTLVNRPQSPAELAALRQCVKRGTPWGDPRWQQRTARKLALEPTLRPHGRPRIHPIKDSRSA